MNNRPIVVAFPFVGDEVGGSHISAINMIVRLDRTKIRPLVVLHQPGGVLAAYLDKMGLTHIAAPAAGNLKPGHRAGLSARLSAAAGFVARLPALISFLKSNGVDIVHTNDGQMHATWALPAKLAGARLLWHHRGDPTAFGVNKLAPLLADQIVTVSNFARPSHPIRSVEGRVTVLHSPFDHPKSLPDRAESRASLAAELGLGADARFVGYFGVLIDRKKPLRFVEIVDAFRKRHPDINLHGLIFGIPEPGGRRLDLEVAELAGRLGLSDRIHLMGFRSPVPPLMCGVEALLVPALNEPFGRTLIEAMLLGTPVIATDHGGNKEAIEHGHNGFLVPPEQPDAFVEPLYRLMTEEGLFDAISTTARAEALVNYGVEKHVAGISALYAQMMAGKTRGTTA